MLIFSFVMWIILTLILGPSSSVNELFFMFGLLLAFSSTGILAMYLYSKEGIISTKKILKFFVKLTVSIGIVLTPLIFIMILFFAEEDMPTGISERIATGIFINLAMILAAFFFLFFFLVIGFGLIAILAALERGIAPEMLLHVTRITKLNIIRAIRRIPEPRTSSTKKKTNILGIVLVVLGSLFILWAVDSNEGAGWMIGLPFLFIGGAMVAYKWVNFRAPITIAGILIIFFMISPVDIPVMSDADYSGAEAFILSGVFLVLAGVFIVMFNSDMLLKALQKTIGRGKSTRAVLKTAISYPMYDKFKTAMTLGMFALIIFTVTVIAMIASMQASQSDAMLREQSGGYDIIGVTNLRTPFDENLTIDYLNDELDEFEIVEFETISSALVKVVDYDRREGQISDYGPSGVITDVEQYSLFGVTDSFLEKNGYSLKERDKKFKTDKEAW